MLVKNRNTYIWKDGSKRESLTSVVLKYNSDNLRGTIKYSFSEINLGNKVKYWQEEWYHQYDQGCLLIDRENSQKGKY